MASLMIHRVAVAAVAVAYVASLGVLGPLDVDSDRNVEPSALTAVLGSSVEDGSLKSLFEGDGVASAPDQALGLDGSWAWSVDANSGLAGPGEEVAAVAVWGDGSEVKARPERLGRLPVLTEAPDGACAGESCGEADVPSAGKGLALDWDGSSTSRPSPRIGEELMAGSRLLLVAGADATL